MTSGGVMSSYGDQGSLSYTAGTVNGGVLSLEGDDNMEK